MVYYEYYCLILVVVVVVVVVVIVVIVAVVIVIVLVVVVVVVAVGFECQSHYFERWGLIILKPDHLFLWLGIIYVEECLCMCKHMLAESCVYSEILVFVKRRRGIR